MPTPWQNVFGVVWGVLILRIVGLLELAHGNPLVTPLVLRVLGKKKKEKEAVAETGAAGVAWIIRKLYARPSHCVAECIQRWGD